MATKKAAPDVTTAVLPQNNGSVMIEPVVRIILPEISDNDSNLAVDQTENVTINGKTTMIKRGEYVDVKVPIFLQLKQRYPNI